MWLWKGNIGVMVDVDTSSECLVVLIHRMFDFLPSHSIRTSTVLPTTIITRHYSGQPWPTSTTTQQILAHAALDCLFYLHMQVLSTLGPQQLPPCCVANVLWGAEGFKSSGELERNI